MKVMQTKQENMQFQQPLKKTVRTHSNSWIIGNHWIHEIKSIEARFPEEDWETAEDMKTYDEFLSDEEEVTGTCIVVSGNTPAEIIADLYDKTK